MIKHRLPLVLLAVPVAVSVRDCVDNYCGPAYPNASDPFCSIRPTTTPQTAAAGYRGSEGAPA